MRPGIRILTGVFGAIFGMIFNNFTDIPVTFIFVVGIGPFGKLSSDIDMLAAVTDGDLASRDSKI